MREYWWKILGVLILAYTIVLGLLVPLKPGIVTAYPASAKAGDTLILTTEGYNTHFDVRTEDVRAWLKFDDKHAIAAKSFKSLDSGQKGEFVFHIPPALPGPGEVFELALVIDSPVDGSYVLPAAVFVTPLEEYAVRGGSWWTVDTIEDLHQNTAFRYPYRNILYETIRNTYFHIPMWFGMILLFLGSAVKSVVYLRNRREKDDMFASALAESGLLFGLLGILTGGLWAMYTWGEFWSFDVKQNVAAISLLIYMAYFVLRASFQDPDRRAVLSAAYNVFAFVMLIPLLFVIPRMTDSLHPGSGGNPAMGGEDLDNTMRMVFYPAVIGWTLIGLWIAQLRYRFRRLENASLE